MIIQTPRQTIDGATPSPVSSDGAQTPRSAMAESMPSARTPARVSMSRQTTPVPTPMAVASGGAPIVDDASTAPTPRDPARRQPNVRPANTPATSKLDPLGGANSGDTKQRSLPIDAAVAGFHTHPTTPTPTPTDPASGAEPIVAGARKTSTSTTRTRRQPNYSRPATAGAVPKELAPGGIQNSDFPQANEVPTPMAAAPPGRPDYRPTRLRPIPKLLASSRLTNTPQATPASLPKVHAPAGPDHRPAILVPLPKVGAPGGPNTHPTTDEPMPNSGAANLVARLKARPQLRSNAHPAIGQSKLTGPAPGGPTYSPRARPTPVPIHDALAGSDSDNAMVTPTPRRPARRPYPSRLAMHRAMPMAPALAGLVTAHLTIRQPMPKAEASGGPYVHGGNVS